MGLLDVYVWRYSHRSCHKGRRSSAQMIEIIIINLKLKYQYCLRLLSCVCPWMNWVFL
jgi:hypothetical protein